MSFELFPGFKTPPTDPSRELRRPVTIQPEEDCGDIDGEPDDEWYCTWCMGDCRTEPDYPIGDLVGGDGLTWCSACGGTGLRKHQTVF